MHLPVAGNCILLKNRGFFLFLHDLSTCSSLEDPSGATLAPACPCTHFLLEENFPILSWLLPEKEGAHSLGAGLDLTFRVTALPQV